MSTTAPYIDFAALKQQVSIHQCVQMLGLDMKMSGPAMRSVCPVHGGGPRTLVVTPAKGVFYCFASSKGGDQIQLVSHVRECAPREAAEQIGKYFGVGQTAEVQRSSPEVQRSKSEAQPSRNSGMEPLTHLEHDHPAVDAVGFDAEVAEAAGIGYTGKGIMKGLVAVPIRLEDGTLIGYIGVDEARMPPRWQLPTNNVVQLQKKPA